jgi:hypothetical protein
MSDPREVTTRVARATWGDHRFRGFGALAELAGHETYMGITMLAATGRRPSDEDRALLDDLSVILASAADPRIWPLKITRLVAAYGGTIAGFVAGQLCTECDAIGPWVTGPAAALLVAVHEATRGRAEAEFAPAASEVLGRFPRLPGFGVAFRPQDERLLALERRVEAAGRAGRVWWSLMRRLSGVVRERRRIEPNVAVGCAALLLDMGATPRQAQVMANFANLNTFIANAIEGGEQPSPALQSIPVDSVRYVGRAPRPLPADR